MLRQFIMFLSLTLVLTACSANTTESQTSEPQDTTQETSQTNQETEESQTTTEETNTPEESAGNDSTEETQAPASVEENYTISDQTLVLEALNTALTLPEIQGLSNSSLQENINTLIAEGANEITSSLDGTNPVTIVYETRMASPTMLSIIFKAEMTVESGTIVFWNPVNISIPTASRVTLDNLFNSNTMAISKFNQTFSEEMANLGYDYDRPEEWMIFAFDANGIHFLVKESDLSEEYTEVTIGNDILLPALNNMFSLN